MKKTNLCINKNYQNTLKLSITFRRKGKANCTGRANCTVQLEGVKSIFCYLQSNPVGPIMMTWEENYNWNHSSILVILVTNQEYYGKLFPVPLSKEE